MSKCRYLVPGALVLTLAAAVAVGAPPPKGPDFEKTARQMVHDAVGVKEKEGVVIVGDESKIPLMKAIAIEVAKAGAFPHIVLDSPEVGERILTEVPVAYLERPNRMWLDTIKHTDVMIELSPVDDPAQFAKVPEERVALARKAGQAVTEMVYTRPMRTVALGNPVMPSAAVARHYGVPQAELEARFWDAVNAPQPAIEASGNKVKAALAAGRDVRITTAAGTDLKLRLAQGRKVGVSDGRIHSAPVGKPEQVWLPAGEVYTSPETTSVNGTVVVPLAEYRGIKIKNLRLTFEAGKLTRLEAAQNAETLKQALAQSSGDKDLFSFIDVGVNPNSRAIPNSDYSTYEMAGMVTIGIGEAPWAESPNQSEFSQAFFVPRATLEIDGKPIVKEGRLTL